MEIKPSKTISGSAFNGNSLQATKPLSNIAQREKTNYVSLTQWCARNFVTKRIGRTLIVKKLLIGQRMWGQWWVCANPDCLEELLDYLGMDELLFDAENEY